MLTRPIAVTNPFRVVVAASEDTLRSTLRQQLEREPRVLVVGEAPDSRAAHRLMRRLMPDVLVIECELNRDLVAQRKNGNNSESVPNVVVLVRPEPHLILEALELGALGVVLKGSLPAEWVPGIERVIAGQYWVGAESIAILLRAARQFLKPEKGRPEKVQPDTTQLRGLGLTHRETEIARKIAVGRSNRELSLEFSICERTVKHHLTNIFRKMGVSSRLELALLVRDSVTSGSLSPNPIVLQAAGDFDAA